MKILVADDDPINRRLLEVFLIKGDYEVVIARNGDEAWNILQQPDSPKLAILDWSMPGMEGTEICRQLRMRNESAYVYVLLLTSMSGENELVAGLNAGADDYLTKPFKGEELKARLRTGRRILALQEQLISANIALNFQLAHDALTGVLSRSAAMEKLRIELTRAKREKTSVGILMTDLDRFKQINDTYGHMAGDEVLREAARRMRSSVRPYDSVGRYGGEEFLIVMPGCDVPAALNRAEGLRKAISQEPVNTAEGMISISISAGVMVGSQPAELEALLRSADLALYDAKRKGRNRVELFTPQTTASGQATGELEPRNPAGESSTLEAGGSGNGS